MASLTANLAHFSVFFSAWLTFLIAGLISFYAQFRMNHEGMTLLGYLGHCFPLKHWTSKSVQMDFKIYLITKLTGGWPGPVSTLLILAFVATHLADGCRYLFPNFQPFHPGYMSVIALSIILFVISELADYLTHFMQHKIPILWEFHKVHHSATFLSPLSSKRGHPIAGLIDGSGRGLLLGLPAGFIAFLFGLNLPDILFLHACTIKIATIATLDSLRHSHFPMSLGPFDKIFVSPHMHQIHHSCHPEHIDRNFGFSLSIFDWMFGTAYLPAKNETPKYGLDTGEEQDFDHVAGVYAGPFVKAWRRAEQMWGHPVEAPAARPYSIADQWRWLASRWSKTWDSRHSWSQSAKRVLAGGWRSSL